MWSPIMSDYTQLPPPNSTPLHSPFARASQEWDTRIGTAAASAANWRRIAFASMFIASISVAGVIWQSSQIKIVPYVVQVTEVGNRLSVEPIADFYKPTERQMTHTLADWLKKVESRSTDPIVVRSNWTSAFDFLALDALTYMTQRARKNDPFAKIGLEAISIKINKASKISPKTYQLSYTKQFYLKGKHARDEKWTATFTTSVQPGRDVEGILKNPLGIYINAVDLNKDFTQ